MEIFTLLETLEDILEKSRNVPFSSKCIVDKEEVLDIIKEIRLKLPDELKQAKWVKEERQKILVQAQNEADDIIKEAENRIISMIDEHEITKKAYEQKNKIIDELLDTFEIERSLSKKGCPYDNAVAEAGYKIIKTEFAFDRIFESLEQLKLELRSYVLWYNNKRIHSALGYMTPVEYRISNMTE